MINKDWNVMEWFLDLGPLALPYEVWIKVLEKYIVKNLV